MHITVTTTDSIEGKRIVEYIDVLKSSVVVGTDIALADLFGGTSQKYRNRLNNSYDKAMLDLKLKGVTVGADAIVGLHTDFEEIFGKGKTRFVVSMVGTAVKLAPSDGNVFSDEALPSTPSYNQCNGEVSRQTLRRHQLLLSLRDKFGNPDFNPDNDDWNNIISYSLYDVAPSLYLRYLELNSETVSNVPLNEKKLMLANFIPFLKSMRFEDACSVVYSNIHTAPYFTSDVIKT